MKTTNEKNITEDQLHVSDDLKKFLFNFHYLIWLVELI